MPWAERVAAARSGARPCGSAGAGAAPRPSVALEKTPEFLKQHMPHCYALACPGLADSLKLDLSGASKSPLAVEMASGLAALAEAAKARSELGAAEQEPRGSRCGRSRSPPAGRRARKRDIVVL